MVNYTDRVGGKKTNKQEKDDSKTSTKKERKACHLNVTVITITEQELTAGGTVLTMKQSWYRITKYQRPLSSRNKRALPELTVGCSW
jgi:ribosome biogenesis protein Tsr3